jgi:hypothetical protein
MSAPQRLERLAFNKLTRAAKTATAGGASDWRRLGQGQQPLIRGILAAHDIRALKRLVLIK